MEKYFEPNKEAVLVYTNIIDKSVEMNEDQCKVTIL